MNDRRELFGWYVYDWANSAFYTTVVTVFLGPYLTAVAKAAADAEGFVHPLGLKIRPGSVFSLAVFLSVFLQMLVLPLLGAISDYSNLKKQLLIFFAYTGSFATMGMYFLKGDNYLLGVVLFVIANLSIGASLVFYNAYLNDVASPDRRDSVSSIGFAWGYAGGGLLLAANIALYVKRESLGLSESHAIRISLLSSGLWWALFTLVPLALLKRRRAVRSLPPGENRISVGFKQLKHTIKSLTRYPQTLLFLLAFLLYNDGIQSVIALAAQFGSEELKLETLTLTTTVLIVQFVAFFGATIFNFIAKAVGTKRAIIISLIIWVGTSHLRLRGAQDRARFYDHGRSHRHSARWEPGAQPLALLVDDSGRKGGRVFQPLRSERQGNQLAWAAAVRAGISIHRQLPPLDSFANNISDRRTRAVCFLSTLTRQLRKQKAVGRRQKPQGSKQLTLLISPITAYCLLITSTERKKDSGPKRDPSSRISRALEAPDRESFFRCPSSR